MKILLNNLSKFFSIMVIVSLVLSCASQDSPQQNHSEISNFENRYFVLDFDKETYEFAEIESRFFTTFPHDDPTRGDVVYDRQKWVNKDMIRLVNGDGIYLHIKDRKDNQWFDSVRLTSKAYYNLNQDNQKILFVFKGKFPSAKGIWPAWWLNGSRQDEWLYKKSGSVETDSDLDTYSGKGHFYDTPSAVNPTDWPAAGEIDIIETINGQNLIHNTIHTCPQMCDSEWNSDGIIINCANAKGGDPNSGCSGIPYKVESIEGTFACLWERNTITYYYWEPQEDVRLNNGPLSKNPMPDKWPAENLKNQVRLLETEAECDAKLHEEWQCKSCQSSNSCVFSNMKIIFNITLCGKWAGDKFDDSAKSLDNCKSYLFNEGRDNINNQHIKIEYVSAGKLQ